MSIIEEKYKTITDDILLTERDCGGELYDLTVSSRMHDNPQFNTGELKFKQALEHGISETIQKFINELKIMIKDGLDDKTEKRIKRKDILEEILEIDNVLSSFKEDNMLHKTNFAKFFAVTTNYLCGGNGIDQFENQPLIVTVAGGNPLKIFFGLITYIKDTDVDEFVDMYFSEIGNLSKDATELEKNRAVEAKKNVKEIVKNIHDCLNASLLSRNTKNLKMDIETVYSKIENIFIDDKVNNITNYSDMDFAITPNKEEILIKYFGITSSKEAISIRGGGGPKKDREPSSALEVPLQLEPPVSSRPKRNRGPPAQSLAEEQAKEELERLKRKKSATTKVSKRKQPEKSSQKSPTRKRTKQLSEKPASQKPETTKANEGFLLVRLKTQNIYKRNSGETGDPFEGVQEPYKSLLSQMNKYKQKVKRTDKDKLEIPFCSEDDRLKLNQRSYIKLVQPNLFRKSYLKLAEEEPCKLSEECQKFMKFLNASKELTGKLSDNNTKKFILGLTSEPVDNNNNLANFMKFLHISTKKQNNKIEKLFNNKEKLTYDANGITNKEVLPKYKNIEDVKDNFETIENISNPKRPLFKLMCELVLEFSKRDEIKEFLVKISQQFKGPHKKEMNYGTYVNIPNKNSYILDKGNYSLKYSNDKGELSAHSKITTNLTVKPGIIKSEKPEKTAKELKEEMESILDYEGSRDDVYEAQEFYDLLEGMNKLAIDSGRKKRTKRKKNKKCKSMRKKNTKKNNKR